MGPLCRRCSRTPPRSQTAYVSPPVRLSTTIHAEGQHTIAWSCERARGLLDEHLPPRLLVAPGQDLLVTREWLHVVAVEDPVHGAELAQVISEPLGGDRRKCLQQVLPSDDRAGYFDGLMCDSPRPGTRDCEVLARIAGGLLQPGLRHDDKQRATLSVGAKRRYVGFQLAVAERGPELRLDLDYGLALRVPSFEIGPSSILLAASACQLSPGLNE